MLCGVVHINKVKIVPADGVELIADILNGLGDVGLYLSRGEVVCVEMAGRVLCCENFVVAEHSLDPVVEREAGVVEVAVRVVPSIVFAEVANLITNEVFDEVVLDVDIGEEVDEELFIVLHSGTKKVDLGVGVEVVVSDGFEVVFEVLEVVVASFGIVNVLKVFVVGRLVEVDISEPVRGHGLSSVVSKNCLRINGSAGHDYSGLTRRRLQRGLDRYVLQRLIDATETVDETLPDSRTVRIDGAAHFGPTSKTDHFVKEVLAFLHEP